MNTAAEKIIKSVLDDILCKVCVELQPLKPLILGFDCKDSVGAWLVEVNEVFNHINKEHLKYFNVQIQLVPGMTNRSEMSLNARLLPSNISRYNSDDLHNGDDLNTFVTQICEKLNINIDVLAILIQSYFGSRLPRSHKEMIDRDGPSTDPYEGDHDFDPNDDVPF